MKNETLCVEAFPMRVITADEIDMISGGKPVQTPAAGASLDFSIKGTVNPTTGKGGVEASVTLTVHF